MADNVTANAGTGGATIAADDIGGVHYQRVKLSLGADGAAVDAVAGAGTVSTAVQRVTLASDDPAVASLAVLDDVILAEDDAHSSGDKGIMALTLRKATVPTDRSAGNTDGDYEPLQTDANGRLYANSSIYTPAGDSAMDDTNDCVKVSIVADSVGSTVDTEDGSIAAAQANVALTAGLNYVYDGSAWVRRVTSHLIDDAAFTPGTTGVTVAGFQADEASTDSVDEGDAGAARMTLDRKVIVTPQPHATGGCSIFRTLDADETEEDVKTSPGCVYGMWATNTNTSSVFVKFYNATAANTTVGSTTPAITICLPGNASDDVSANFGPGGMGIFFDTAICVAAVTEAADNGTTAPSANSVILNIFYK